MIGRTATGEIEDEREALSGAAAELGGKGGEARAEVTMRERQAEIAPVAALKFKLRC